MRQSFRTAEDKALEHDTLLDIFVKPKDGEPDLHQIDEKKGQLATYTPPISLLYGAERDDRMLESIVWAVKLRPAFLMRVIDARVDSSV